MLCVTDITGTPLVNYTYDAWGAFTMEPASPQVSSTDLLYVSMLNPVTYRGYFYDLELGLYYLQSRYYDPETGRFLSMDVTCESGESIVSSNVFNYAENSPIIIANCDGDNNNPVQIFGFERETCELKTQWKSQQKAFQRVFGYCDLYDNAARWMSIFSIDCLISEFDYDFKSWRVEFWKGRYGPYIGGEIGFYYNRLVFWVKKIMPVDPANVLYRSSTDELFEIEYIVYSVNENTLVPEITMQKQKHWWLAGMIWKDDAKIFNKESVNLQMTASITFESAAMASAFCANLGARVKEGLFDVDDSHGDVVYVKWATEQSYLEELKFLHELSQAA